ncbi:hypothetical protein CYMTET_13482, partial [Cymbomonas tetramitiformis]
PVFCGNGVPKEWSENNMHKRFTDPATVAALNTAQDFLLHGVEPRKGLDELDRVLIRKMALRQDCGPTRAYTIGWERISLELLCATRLTLVAEPELDLLCPKPWSWNDQCTGAVFKWRQPISRENEEAVIASLRNTIHGLLGGYPTAVEEDQALLELPQLLHVREHSAVLLRMREKLLLRNALTLLQELEMGLDTAQYQAPTIPKWRAPLMLAPGEPLAEVHPLWSVPVNFGEGHEVSMEGYEGQPLERVVTSFSAKYDLSSADAVKLAAEAHHRMPADYAVPKLEVAFEVEVPGRGRRILAVYSGESVGDAVEAFCSHYGVPREAMPDLMASAEHRHAGRAMQRTLVEVPVRGEDGRERVLEVRQGDQHNLQARVEHFVAALLFPEDAVPQLLQAVKDRLPEVMGVATVPGLEGSGEPDLEIHIYKGDDPYEVAKAFCVTRELDEAQVLPKLMRALQAKMRSLQMKVPTDFFFTRNSLFGD